MTEGERLHRREAKRDRRHRRIKRRTLAETVRRERQHAARVVLGESQLHQLGKRAEAARGKSRKRLPKLLIYRGEMPTAKVEELLIQGGRS